MMFVDFDKCNTCNVVVKECCHVADAKMGLLFRLRYGDELYRPPYDFRSSSSMKFF